MKVPAQESPGDELAGVSAKLLWQVLAKIDVLIAGQEAIAGKVGISPPRRCPEDLIVTSSPWAHTPPSETSRAMTVAPSDYGPLMTFKQSESDESHTVAHVPSENVRSVARLPSENGCLMARVPSEGNRVIKQASIRDDKTTERIIFSEEHEGERMMASASSGSMGKELSGTTRSSSHDNQSEPLEAGRLVLIRRDYINRMHRRTTMEHHRTSHLATQPGQMREVDVQRQFSVVSQTERALSMLMSWSGSRSGRKRFKTCFPLSPSSRIVMTIDLLAMLLLCYDAIMIPYGLAFGLKMDGLLAFFAWTSAIFWTVDLLLRFVTGFAGDDAMIKDLKRIAARYLRRFFLIDVTVVLIDWLAIFFEISSDPGAENSSRRALLNTVRLLKATRMVRIYTMLKTGKATQLQEIITHKTARMGIATVTRLVGSLAKLVFIILWLNHIGACCWVSFQDHQQVDDMNNSWARSVSELKGGASYLEAAESYRYLIAFYWSISAMFAGASFLVPMTTTETVFASVCILFGALFASTIISSMAAMLIDSQMANREMTTAIQQLKHFLQQQQVDPILSVMIQRQALQRMSKERRLAEGDVTALSILSAELREQLRLTLRSPLITKQFLWGMCDPIDDQLVKSLCRFAIRSVALTPGDILFEPADAVDQSYILVWGTMQYTLESALQRATTTDSGDSQSSSTHSTFSGNYSSQASSPVALSGSITSSRLERITKIAAGEHACEIALWAEWRALGLMEAESHCELLKCSADGIREVLLLANEHARLIICCYAEALVNSFEVTKVAQLSDLHSPTDCDSTVALMPQEARVVMSQPALHALKKQFGFGPLRSLASFTEKQNMDITKLEAEVKDGDCNLKVENGRVLRIVHVVALRMKRPDSRMCVQLGKMVEGVVTPSLELPGMKMRMLETAVCSARRLIATRFAKLTPFITIMDYDTSVEERASATYYISTRYIRTVVKASLTLPIDTDMHIEKIPFREGGGYVEVFGLPRESGFNVFAFMPTTLYTSMTADADHAVEVTEMIKKWTLAVGAYGSEASTRKRTESELDMTGSMTGRIRQLSSIAVADTGETLEAVSSRGIDANDADLPLTSV